MGVQMLARLERCSLAGGNSSSNARFSKSCGWHCEHLKSAPRVNARGMKRVPPHASPKVGNIRLPDGTAEVLDVLALLNGISFFCADTLELYPRSEEHTSELQSLRH